MNLTDSHYTFEIFFKELADLLSHKEEEKRNKSSSRCDGVPVRRGRVVSAHEIMKTEAHVVSACDHTHTHS